MKNILEQHKQEAAVLQSGKYIDRLHGYNKDEILRSSLVKLITGPRRSGKSVFAFLLLKDLPFAYMNFDDDDLLKVFSYDKMMEILPQVFPGFKYIFLDEIQNLDNWESLVNKLHRRGHNLILTGSNSKLLSREMSTALTGRYLPIHLLPFSFKEFLSSQHKSFNPQNIRTPDDLGSVLQVMQQYMTNGGFPESVNNPLLADEYLSTLFDSVLLKDIIRRFSIKNAQQLYSLANYMLTIFSGTFTYNSLREILGMKSTTTVQKFASYLEEPFLFYYMSRFGNKVSIRSKSPKKVYVVDNGFIKSRSHELSPNYGRRLENLVFIELIRRGYRPDLDLFYYRTQNNKEIDFLCKKGHQNEYLIQVCYDISKPATLKREISALTEASMELNPAKSILLTWNETPQLSSPIISLPVWKWLLAERD